MSEGETPKCQGNTGACRGEVTLAPCPYMSEIHDFHTPVWMCEGCRDERSQDI